MVTAKRKNPFSQSQPVENSAKRQRSLDLDLNSEDTMFQLLNSTETKVEKNIEAPLSQPYHLPEVAQPELEPVKEPKSFIPIDWSIKSRLRFIAKTHIAGTNLKTNQESSGMTSFVRCLDLERNETDLDISPGAKFHQGTLYWQHPSLPWLTLYPRNSRGNHGFQLGEVESKSLMNDWAASFQSLFQLVRARQCPYFYVCANTFTVLFRAAGIGGRVETHAILTPTSRGFRAALRQEDIEFTMPLKKMANLEVNRSADSSSLKSLNTSFSNSSEDATQQMPEEESEDEDEEEWLEKLGVAAEEIKRINDRNRRKKQTAECEDDFSEQSLVYIEGADCHALFNFLLNSKSTVAKIGRLANIPPTLLAPVAFKGATLRNLSVRSSKVRVDGEDYSSMELKGVILPHVLPYLSNLLVETKDRFTATITTYPTTLPLTRAAIQLSESADDKTELGNAVFDQENLSNCGLQAFIVKAMCRTGPGSLEVLDKMWYVKEDGGYFY